MRSWRLIGGSRGVLGCWAQQSSSRQQLLLRGLPRRCIAPYGGSTRGPREDDDGKPLPALKPSQAGRITVGYDGKLKNKGPRICPGCGAEMVRGISGAASGTQALDMSASTNKRKASFANLTDDGDKLCNRCKQLNTGDVWAAYDAIRDIPPAVFKDQLKFIISRRKFAICIVVVDATDFEGSIVKEVRNIVKNIPIFLAITKCDLLPRMPGRGDVSYLKRRYEKRTGTRVVSAHAISLDGRGFQERSANLVQLAEELLLQLAGRDVFVMGAANVGKSTLVKSLSMLFAVYAMSAWRPSNHKNAKRIRNRQRKLLEEGSGIMKITASHLPGTTLQAIRVPCMTTSDAHALWDTPGVILPTSIQYHIYPSHLMEPLLRPTPITHQRTLRVRPGETVLFEAEWTVAPRTALARLDIVSVDDLDVKVDVYTPTAILTRVVKTPDAPTHSEFSEASIESVREILSKHTMESDFLADNLRAPEPKKFIEFEDVLSPPHDPLKNINGVDIVFSSVGWVCVSNHKQRKFQLKPLSIDGTRWYARKPPIYHRPPRANEGYGAEENVELTSEVVNTRISEAAKHGRHGANHENKLFDSGGRELRPESVLDDFLADDPWA